MKKTLLTIVLALCGLTVVARPVDSGTAARVAANFWNAHRDAGVAALTEPMKPVRVPFDGMYLFVAGERGFVLVAADDRVQPILGYSFTAPAGEELHPEVRYWLEGYQRQIDDLRNSEGGERDAGWDLYEHAPQGDPVPLTAVSPLLTTTWGQGANYNNLCPYDASGSSYYNYRTPTGCVATATAQIMKYHNHPATGYGSHSYTHSSYGTLSADFGSTTYAWSSMPNALTSASSSTQKTAVATLMYHVGVADEMNYGTSSSGAKNYNYYGELMPSSQTSLMQYFKYRPDMAPVARADYDAAAFALMLKADLNQQRPILFSGRNTEGGHSFVCDGYNTSDQFHINWGWSGSYDGYFTMGSLNPTGGGTGGSGDNTYNLDNVVLLGISPNANFNSTTTVGVSSGVGGSVSGGGSYSFGDTVRLEATANSGYRFAGWSDGSKFNPREMIATGGSYSFTATFAPVSGDTLHYCPGNFNINSYRANSGTTTWGIKLPQSILNSGDTLQAVQLFVATAGTYNLTVYTGASHATTAASASVAYTTGDEDQWHTIALTTPVPATQDIWIVFSYAGTGYPASYTYGSGVAHSFLWASSLYEDGIAWGVTAMIKGIFGGGTSGGGEGGCTVTTFPYSEGFEGSLDCWSAVDNNNDASTWRAISSIGEGTDAVTPYGGTKMMASFSWNSSAMNADEYLVSPAITLPATGSYSLSFWFRVNGSYPLDKLAVKVSTTGTAASNFTSTLVDITPTAANGSWTQQTVSLAAYAGQTIYLAFHHHDSYDANYIVIDDLQIAAAAAPTQYTLTVQSNNNAWGTVSGGGTYNAGATATLTATASSGYHFLYWNDGLTTNPRTVTVTGNATYTAYFEQDAPTQYTLTVQSNNTAWGTVTGGGTYNAGATATLTATAASGYHFLYWNDGLTTNPRTVTVTGNATYTAYFEQDAPVVDTCTIALFPYSESFNSGLGCWTAVDNNNDASTWRAIGTSTDNPTHSGAGMAASFSWYEVAMNADEYLVSPQIELPSGMMATLSWWFRVNGSYPLDKLAVKVSTTGTAVADFTTTLIDITPTAANGSWTQQTVDLTPYAGQTIYLAFHHHDSYDANYLLVDDIQIATSAMPEQYTITAQSNNSSWGTVSGGGTYYSGTTATLTATPNSGYHFLYWNDGLTTNPRTVTVTGDATYTAYFEQDTVARYTISVVSSNNNWGTVSGGGTFDEGTAVVLTATANSGYHFEKWQDNVTDNPRTVTVTANATYVAIFARNTGIDDVATGQIRLYPNPASSWVTVEWGEETTTGNEGQLEVLDITGRTVLTQPIDRSSEQTTIDVTSLPSGVYYVKIGTHHTSFIINR